MDQEEPKFIPRIKDELRRLMEGSKIAATLIKEGSCYYVKYHAVPTSGKNHGLPETTDVLVPVPESYPTAYIDMPALPEESPLIQHVVGGGNPQGIKKADGKNWQVLSHHPYINGGGPPWNPMVHGFHDYYNHVFTWLHHLI